MNLRGEYLYPTLSNRYLDAMKDKNRINSKATEQTYNAAFKLLQARYPELRAGEILHVERDRDGRFVATRALDWLREGKRREVKARWSENTQATYRKAVSGLVRWAAREGVCEDFSSDLREEFEVKVRTHRASHWLEFEDLALLLKACADAGTLKGERDGMVIRVAGWSGLRCKELTSLTWSQVDFRNGWIYVPEGKGNKERTVGLLEELEPELKAWRQRAAEELGAIPTTHKVLPALKPGGGLWWDRSARLTRAEQCAPAPGARPFVGISTFRAYESVKFWGDKALSIDNLGPHDLRRTFAGLLETAGVPVQEIAKQLGHSSVDTTDRYLSSSPRRRVSALKGVRFGS